MEMRLRTWHANQMQSFDCDRTKHGACCTEHGVLRLWHTSIHIAWTRTMICSNATDRSCGRPSLSLVSLSLFFTCFVQILCKLICCYHSSQGWGGLETGKQAERRGLRQMLYMSRPKLHISNAPAFPANWLNFHAPVTTQLATGPTVASLPQLPLSFCPSVPADFDSLASSIASNSIASWYKQMRLSLYTFLGAKTMKNFSCDWLLKSQSTSAVLHSV